eukprot:scaffold653953_cov42-Prasinocladus_malaysianus.AAC.1
MSGLYAVASLGTRRTVSLDLQVVGVPVDLELPWLGQEDMEALVQRNYKPLFAPWRHTHWLQLITRWLSTLMPSGYGAGEAKQGHIVIMPANTLVNGEVWSAFEGDPFALGVPHRPLAEHFPPGVM